MTIKLYTWNLELVQNCLHGGINHLELMLTTAPQDNNYYRRELMHGAVETVDQMQEYADYGLGLIMEYGPNLLLAILPRWYSRHCCSSALHKWWVLKPLPSSPF